MTPRASQDSAVGSQGCGKPVHLPRALRARDPLLDSHQLFAIAWLGRRRPATAPKGLSRGDALHQKINKIKQAKGSGSNLALS